MDREAAVEAALERIIDFFRPEQVYLFGSQARGDVRPNSDIDFLVVVPDSAGRELWRLGKLYESFIGLGVGIDVVPFRRAAFEEQKSWIMSLPAIVLQEGKLIYDAAWQAA